MARQVNNPKGLPQFFPLTVTGPMEGVEERRRDLEDALTWHETPDWVARRSLRATMASWEMRVDVMPMPMPMPMPCLDSLDFVEYSDVLVLVLLLICWVDAAFCDRGASRNILLCDILEFLICDIFDG